MPAPRHCERCPPLDECDDEGCAAEGCVARRAHAEELAEPNRTLADYDILQGLSDAMLIVLETHPFPALRSWAAHERSARRPAEKA